MNLDHSMILSSFSDFMSTTLDKVKPLVTSMTNTILYDQSHITRDLVHEIHDNIVSVLGNSNTGSIVLNDGTLICLENLGDGDIAAIDNNGNRWPLIHEYEELDYVTKTYNGDDIGVEAITSSLIQDYQTNEALSIFSAELANGQTNLTDILNSISLNGAVITSAAREWINQAKEITSNFTNLDAMGDMVKNVYTSVIGVTAGSQNNVVFNENIKYSVKSAFTTIIGTVISSVASVVSTLVTYAVSPVLGLLLSGAVAVINGVTNLYASEVSDGEININALNSAPNFSFGVRSRQLISDSAIKNALKSKGYSTISKAGSNLHIALNSSSTEEFSWLLMPSLDVAQPWVKKTTGYDWEVNPYTDLSDASLTTQKVESGTSLNISYDMQFSMSFGNQSIVLNRFKSCYGNRPQSILEARLKILTSMAYTYYNTIGLPTSISGHYEYYHHSGSYRSILLDTSIDWYNSHSSYVENIDQFNALNYTEKTAYLALLCNKFLLVSSGDIAIGAGGNMAVSMPISQNDPLQRGSIPLNIMCSWSDIKVYSEMFQSFFSEYYTIDGIIEDYYNNGISLGNVVSFDTYYRTFLIEGPSIERGSILGSIVAIAAIAAAAVAAVVVAKKVIRKFVISRMATKYDAITAEKQRMQTSEYQSQTSREQKARDASNMLSQIKRYNFMAKLTGLSTLSYTSGWENGDGTSTILDSTRPSGSSSTLTDTVYNMLDDANQDQTGNIGQPDNYILEIIKLISGV